MARSVSVWRWGPVFLASILFTSVLVATALFPRPLAVAADPAVVKVLTRNFADGCLDATKAWTASKRQDFAQMLGQNDMTIDDFCTCTARSVFGSLTRQEVDQFLGDSAKYQGNVGDREPWKTRIDTANRRCLAGTWPAED